MSSTVFTLVRESGESLEELYNWFTHGMAAAELSYDQITRTDDADILLVVIEEFYFRSSSMAALTLQCIDDGQYQQAVIIGTGGGEGILNISWGANESFAKKARKLLIEHGFTDES